MLEKLNLPYHLMKPILNEIISDYKDKLGRDVCRSCATDIQFMISSLKRYYMTSQFEFTQTFVMYKIQKGEPETISNDTMTDDKAIRFLQVNPDRIRVFSKYPENWEELIGLKEPKSLKDELNDKTFKELKEEYSDVELTSKATKKEFIESILIIKG